MYTKKEINYFLIIFIAVIFNSCCKNPKLLNIGLTKKATNIKEHIIKIKYDSLNNLIKDTLVLKETSYNKSGKINVQTQKMLFMDERIEVKFVYNSFNKIEKEIVYTSHDSSTFDVNYFYKDTLLFKTISETKNDEFKFSQISKYKYNQNEKLKKILISQIYFDNELNDTIKNTVTLYKYDKNRLLFEAEFIDYKDSTKNQKYKYKYKCNKMIAETKEYNQNNIFISKTKFKYQLDEFGNWIEKKIIKNDTLIRIIVRGIEY